MHKIIVLTTPNCHLCERAVSALIHALEEVPFHLQEVNINDEPSLYEKYKNDIPVVFLEDQEIARHIVDKEEIVHMLRKDIKS